MTIRFGLIGGGWRSEFHLRIARALPERFEVVGAAVRNAEKGAAFERLWGVPTYRSADELVRRAAPSFVVTSVPWAENPGLLTRLAALGVPVLSETPPAPDVESLNELYREVGEDAKIQVAEQYLFQPLHAARIAAARSGLLGEISQAQVSAAHGYHGVSLIRQLLGVRFEDASIRATVFESPIIEGSGRGGKPERERLIRTSQTVAWLEYGGKLGVFDFTGDQYFSWIRSQRVQARGERGEINDGTVRYLKDFLTPVELEFKRADAGENGNLEGYYHKGYLLGSEWVYTNPLAPARLSDDEIAVGTSLLRMDEYVRGGASFYSLAEASQDHYLGMLIDRAAKSGETVRTAPQSWAR